MELTLTQRNAFELLNTAWSVLEPHIDDEKDKKVYKKIMGEVFRMFFAESDETFSTSWWADTTTVFLEYPQKYKDTIYYDFASELSFGILNYWEYCSKHCEKLTFNSAVFYREIQNAFTEEWVRIGERYM